MKNGSVYLETTVVSYYTARPSRDIVQLAHQEITRRWWQLAHRRFDLFISELVIEEASAGDSNAAKHRLEVISRFTMLQLNEAVEGLTVAYMNGLNLPAKYARDAAHVAVAAIHGMDYLVTWNCTHIANGEIIRKIIRINEQLGFATPIICTPEELMPAK
jgi:predicted nucleic acid-binding protein